MIDSRAYSQVFYIINSMSAKTRDKIPSNIRRNIENKMDKDYKFKFDNISDVKLLNDTEKILSVLYTDYFSNKEERKVIKEKEKRLWIKAEKQKKELYDVNVFKSKEISNNSMPAQENSMVVRKDNFWTRIIDKIKQILKK